MSILDPRFWLAIIGAMALAFGGGYATHWKQAKNKAVAAGFEQYKVDTKKVINAADKLEVKNDKREIEYRTITKQVDRIVQVPIYRADCIDSNGLRVLNQTLKGGTAVKPDKAMPSAK